MTMSLTEMLYFSILCLCYYMFNKIQICSSSEDKNLHCTFIIQSWKYKWKVNNISEALIFCSPCVLGWVALEWGAAMKLKLYLLSSSYARYCKAVTDHCGNNRVSEMITRFLIKSAMFRILKEKVYRWKTEVFCDRSCLSCDYNIEASISITVFCAKTVLCFHL